MRFILLLFTFLIFYSLCFSQTNPSKDEHYKQMLESIKLQAKPEYVKAYSNIEELREDVSLAKRKLMLKKDVVKRFNELVGKVMGNLNSFDEVERRLKASGDSYVTFMYDNEIARIAREKAGEKKFDSTTP